MLRKNLAIIVSLEARSKMFYKKVFLKIFQCSQKKPSTGDLLFTKLQPEKFSKFTRYYLCRSFVFRKVAEYKDLQNSKENSCARALVLMKLQAKKFRKIYRQLYRSLAFNKAVDLQLEQLLFLRQIFAFLKYHRSC